MSRLKSFGVIIAVIGGVAGAWPASAQFGTIFGDTPRPPADVPSRAPATRASPPLPATLPPPPPPQGNEIPVRAPPPGSIQSEPLPPPPGAESAPPQQSSLPRPSGVPPLPGLPPGQRQPRGTPQPASTAPQPGDEVVTELPSQKIANQSAVFSGLDKITGRIITFDVMINETVQFGALQVTPRVCYTRPPTETPNTDAFIDVDEITLQGEVRHIFGGWMFAASPGLHAVEHPIYDVWLVDCKSAAPAVTAGPPPPAPPPAAPKPPARR